MAMLVYRSVVVFQASFFTGETTCGSVQLEQRCSELLWHEPLNPDWFRFRDPEFMAYAIISLGTIYNPLDTAFFLVLVTAHMFHTTLPKANSSPSSPPENGIYLTIPTPWKGTILRGKWSSNHHSSGLRNVLRKGLHLKSYSEDILLDRTGFGFLGVGINNIFTNLDYFFLQSPPFGGRFFYNLIQLTPHVITPRNEALVRDY